MNAHEIYEKITNTIIQLLETHLEDFNKPWIALDADSDYARNPAGARYYRGINQFLLSFEMMEKGYLKNAWMTYNQIQEMEGHVLKNEKSTTVIFYKTAFIDKNKKYYSPETVKTLGIDRMANLNIQPIPVLKLYHVFNVAQTEGLPSDFYEFKVTEELQEFQKDEAAENLVMNTGAQIEIKGSNRAYYNRAADKIIIPLREQFKGQVEPFYGVILHELGHWTGASHRLNRTFGKEFGDEDYAKEELVAELTSAFCCAHLGFSKTISQNASYLKNWLGIMRNDTKAIIKASADAQRAADFIIGGAEYSSYQKEQ